MADVTGPISSLPGSRHVLPDADTQCDRHSDRLAIARVQGETDSFGCEISDLCQECVDELLTHEKEARCGVCEWCRAQATDLRDARDYDEGMCGRVYRVCGPCVRKQAEEARLELEESRDDYDDYDDYDDREDFE